MTGPMYALRARDGAGVAALSPMRKFNKQSKSSKIKCRSVTGVAAIKSADCRVQRWSIYNEPSRVASARRV